MKQEAITPKVVTEIGAAEADKVSAICEKVLELDKKMTSCATELDNLSDALDNLAHTKQSYDKSAGEVKRQMRELIPIL